MQNHVDTQHYRKRGKKGLWFILYSLIAGFVFEILNEEIIAAIFDLPTTHGVIKMANNASLVLFAVVIPLLSVVWAIVHFHKARRQTDEESLRLKKSNSNYLIGSYVLLVLGVVVSVLILTTTRF